MNHHNLDACTGYLACTLALYIQEINWATLGAAVLLIARLLTDVPAAYKSLRSLLKPGKKDK